MLSMLLVAGALVAPAEARVAYPCHDYTDHGCPCVDSNLWRFPCDEYRCDRYPWDSRCEHWPVKPYSHAYA